MGCMNMPVECTDGNACTANFCSGEVGCTSTPVNCNDGNACTMDICDPATGCKHLPPDCTNGGPCCEPGPCVPQCAPGQCSDNGCGVPCGECGPGEVCGDSNTCEPCQPNCTGKVCGSDGCNGSCGICDAGTECSPEGDKCISPCPGCADGLCQVLDFENGLTGWDIDGDVTVIPQLGITLAPEGMSMLRLSTGLSYAAPSYAQKSICLEQTPQTVTFMWRYYSEEFQEYCGSQFQDIFSVTFVVDGVETELYNVKVDDLCSTTSGTCGSQPGKCGSKFVGLEKSDIHFDQGEAWATPWQTTTLTLPPGAEAGTIIFEVTDVGDSIYDTVVILDNVQFE